MKTILGGTKKKGSSRTKSSSSSSKEAKAKALIGKTIEVKNRRFKVKEVLGEGGYSNVYRVVEEGSNNVYALKRMLVRADEMDLIKREVSLMKSIPTHRNLIHFECANVTTSSEKRKGEDLMEANIIMEYADVRLFDVMEARHTEGKFFTEPELINIMADVCEGVAVLHHHRPPIAHRDIKVENVLLGNDGAYKLCDFGSATSVVHHPKTAAERDAAEADIERNTTMVYRAPEMLDLYAVKPINEKADIWALGCMLYKMCFFEDAFSIGGRLAILKASFSFPLTPKYSTELNDLIRRMLELDAEQRPDITWVIQRLQRLKAHPSGSEFDTPGKHRRSRTWGGSQDSLDGDELPPPGGDGEIQPSPHSSGSLSSSFPDKVIATTPFSLYGTHATSTRERGPSLPKGSDADAFRPSPVMVAPPPGGGSPGQEQKTALRDSRRAKRNSTHARRDQLHFDGQSGDGVSGDLSNGRASPGGEQHVFAIPAPPGHRKTSFSAASSPLLMPETATSTHTSPSLHLAPSPHMASLMPTSPSLMPGSPMLGMMSMSPLGSGGTLPHPLGGLSMMPLGSGSNQGAGGLTMTPIPSGGGNQGLTMTPIPSGGGNQGGGLTITPLASGGNASGGLTLSPLASGGLTMLPRTSGNNPSGGLTMNPLTSGGNPGLAMNGGLTMNTLASGGGLTMTPLASGGGLTMTPLASGGGLTMTPLTSGNASGGLTMAPLTSGGKVSMSAMGYGGLTMNPLTSGGADGNAAQVAAMGGMSIKPLTSGGASRGPTGNTTPTRGGISKSSGGSNGGGMSILPTASGSGREKEGRGEIITFETMMQLIERERESEHERKSHSVDSANLHEALDKAHHGRSPSAGGSSHKKKKKKRREVIPGSTISSSDEDGVNMLGSTEHDFGSEGSKETTKLKMLRKTVQMKEKGGFKEIRAKGDGGSGSGGSGGGMLSDEGLSGKEAKKGNRRSKLFGKLGQIEYAGEGPIDSSDAAIGLHHPEDELSPFSVASSPPIPLAVALASTSKESKQTQFLNADIALHQPFLKHNFDVEFVFTADYLARKAIAQGHRLWALAPADTPVDDARIWAGNGVTDKFFAHLKSRKLTKTFDKCMQCLLSLFRMLQESSPAILMECYQQLAWLQSLRSAAKSLEKGQAVQLMCTFLAKKIEFHQRHPQFEGTYSLQTHHAQQRQKSDQFALDQAVSFQELEDLLGVQQALVDIPNLFFSQLDTYGGLALEALPLLVAESHAILSMSTYLLVKLKVFSMDKDKQGTFQELKGSYKALYHVLSRFYAQTLQYTTIAPSLVPVLAQRQKISVSLNLQALQYPVSHNPHFAQVRLKGLPREASVQHDKDREKKERKERERREKDERKRERERSKMEKKREKEFKKAASKKMGKDFKKELKREMQKEWEEELERERERDTTKTTTAVGGIAVAGSAASAVRLGVSTGGAGGSSGIGGGSESSSPASPPRRLAASLAAFDANNPSPTVERRSDSSGDEATARGGGAASDVGDEAKQQAEIKARLEKLLQLPENKTCAECGASGPRWASLNLGVFVCLGCSGVHRGLGTHVSKVKSCTLDTWNHRHVDLMEMMGNKKASELWEARVPPTYQRPTEHSPKEQIKRWIEDKYVYKRFRDELHSSAKRPPSRRRLEPSMSSGAFQLPGQHHPPPLIVSEASRTASLMEMPMISAAAAAAAPAGAVGGGHQQHHHAESNVEETQHGPLKRTHSRSKSYAGHEKHMINEFDVSRLISQQKAIYAAERPSGDSSWNPFS